MVSHNGFGSRFLSRPSRATMIEKDESLTESPDRPTRWELLKIRQWRARGRSRDNGLLRAYHKRELNFSRSDGGEIVE